MTYVSAIAVAGLAILLPWILKTLVFSKRTALAPLPPGPKALPVLGNITDRIPSGMPEFAHWVKHKHRYGPISSVTSLGQTIVILHDKSMAVELMDKRGSRHSGRPRMKFAMDMIGWINSIISQQYNETFRRYRKYANQQLTKPIIRKYSQLQEAAVGHFLWRLHHSKGENLLRHIKTEAGEIILKIIYGYSVDPHANDPLVGMASRTVNQFSAATVPGAWLVDILPVLEYLPEWMPGAEFKRTARIWRQSLIETVTLPYKFAKWRMVIGKDNTSFVARSIEQAKSEEGSFSQEDEHAIKWSASSLYFGGTDTTIETIHAFFLAMVMFPDVREKAQEEIDRVVGLSRLPNFTDRDSLPYINAIVKEALRWHPIVPMGFPHVSDEEDFIAGYRIPKGSILLPAIWWFSRDPEVYHDAEAFKPERYSEPYNEPLPMDFIFGFGRRVCPGQHLGEASMYLTFVQSLAVFNFENMGDDPTHGFMPGIISRSSAFQIRLTPRTSQHKCLIDDIPQRFPWEASDQDFLGDLG